MNGSDWTRVEDHAADRLRPWQKTTANLVLFSVEESWPLFLRYMMRVFELTIYSVIFPAPTLSAVHIMQSSVLIG